MSAIRRYLASRNFSQSTSSLPSLRHQELKASRIMSNTQPANLPYSHKLEKDVQGQMQDSTQDAPSSTILYSSNRLVIDEDLPGYLSEEEARCISVSTVSVDGDECLDSSDCQFLGPENLLSKDPSPSYPSPRSSAPKSNYAPYSKDCDSVCTTQKTWQPFIQTLNQSPTVTPATTIMFQYGHWHYLPVPQQLQQFPVMQSPTYRLMNPLPARSQALHYKYSRLQITQLKGIFFGSLAPCRTFEERFVLARQLGLSDASIHIWLHQEIHNCHAQQSNNPHRTSVLMANGQFHPIQPTHLWLPPPISSKAFVFHPKHSPTQQMTPSSGPASVISTNASPKDTLSSNKFIYSIAPNLLENISDDECE